jgi:hypothetical protein
VAGLALCLSSFAAQALFDADDVLDCAALNAPDSSFSETTDIEVKDNSGKHRKMQARVLGQRNDTELLLNLRLTSPGNMAGTTVLVRERAKQNDDIRLYLPAMQRTRYISDAMSTTKLFDTDFSYADFKQLYGAFTDGTIEYQGIEKWHGRNVHKLRIFPSPETQQPYNSLITRIDTDTCVIMGMDFLDVQDNPQRQLVADETSLTNIDGRHLAQRYTMSDLLKGSSTTLQIKRVAMDEKIPKDAFDPETFFNPH